MVPVVRRSRAITRAFATLDEVNLEEVFRDRALVMKKLPAFLKRAYQGAVLACNAGGSVRDKVTAIKNTRVETLLVVAENSPLQTGQGRVDPQEQAP